MKVVLVRTPSDTAPPPERYRDENLLSHMIRKLSTGQSSAENFYIQRDGDGMFHLAEVIENGAAGHGVSQTLLQAQKKAQELVFSRMREKIPQKNVPDTYEG